MRTLLIASVVASALGGLAGTASADDTFESLAASAQKIKRIDDVIWALTAKCDGGTDTEQRQCRRIRDVRAAELKNATLLVDGDRDAFKVGEWSAAKKSAPLSVLSCIRCGGIDVEGKAWFVAGTRDANQPPRFQAGKQVGNLLEETTKQFSDAAAAKKYSESVATARVQFVLRVPQNPVWTDSNKQGIAFEVLAYRVYSTCDGSVVVAKPKAGPGDIDKRACAGIPPVGVEVDELTPAMIKESLKSTLESATASCQAKHQGQGKGKLKLQIGPDGTITSSKLEGELAGTETAKCIEDAVKNAKLPKSKKPKTSCAVPILLP
jgi:hypothetical protein